MLVINREMDYDSAVIAMVDANIQREEILPSEKAAAYNGFYPDREEDIQAAG